MELKVDTVLPSNSYTNNASAPLVVIGDTAAALPPASAAAPPPPLHPPPRIPTLSFMYTTEKMSSSTDDSEDLADPLCEELRNVQSVMHVTRENIDALNAKFANFQEPPSMYLEEYQELTSKLHELEIKEQELNERLQQPGAGANGKAAAVSTDGGRSPLAALDEVSRRMQTNKKSINRIYTRDSAL